MNNRQIQIICDYILKDVRAGKTVRIIGDMSSKKKNAVKYLRFRNMVNWDFGGNICYAGFSKKDFKKICRQLEKFDSLDWCVLYTDATVGCSEGTVIICPRH